MNKHCAILTFLLLFFFTAFSLTAKNLSVEDEVTVLDGGIRLPVHFFRGDTIFLVNLRELVVFPPMVFESKKAEKHYWRTVRDVKKALPLAKIAANELVETNKYLLTLSTDKERKEYLKEIEKSLFKKHEPELRKMTISQGKMLIKLVDRECDNSSYELIKRYRGSVTAVFWQGIARIFGSNLKTTYNLSNEEDRKIERVVTLVEAGAL